MKILTVGASPYLLVRDGKMNSDILHLLKEQGHTIGSAVWHHDGGYFMPDQNGICHFEDASGHICELYTLPERAAETALYEIMKKFQPQMVISIGDYKQVDFVYSIKAMYPNLFKWIAVYPTECLWINENYRDRLEYADYSVCTSDFGWGNLRNLCNVAGERLSYGPNLDKFPYVERNFAEKPVFLTAAHNSQASNLGAFILGVGGTPNVLGKIHTNLYDTGDYDLELICRRYGASNISLPDYYCSVKEGLNDADYAKLLQSADFYVETSIKSATGLSMLEAMATGCVPIGMECGRVGEIIAMMPAKYRFFVEGNVFLGSLEEEYSIISVKELRNRIYELKKDIFTDRSKYMEASLAARIVAEELSSQNFLKQFSMILKHVAESENSVAVESF